MTRSIVSLRDRESRASDKGKLDWPRFPLRSGLRLVAFRADLTRGRREQRHMARQELMSLMHALLEVESVSDLPAKDIYLTCESFAIVTSQKGCYVLMLAGGKKE
uniref:Uncharacterized protein n=1 Tax=Anopheles merus TaxID=30066 RepID=A0A182V1M2_ANOME